jgi:hypothetical protein
MLNLDILAIFLVQFNTRGGMDQIFESHALNILGIQHSIGGKKYGKI